MVEIQHEGSYFLDYEMGDFECLPSLYIIPTRKQDFKPSENKIINF